MPVLPISSTGLTRHHKLSTQHEAVYAKMTEEVLIFHTNNGFFLGFGEPLCRDLRHLYERVSVVLSHPLFAMRMQFSYGRSV
jgi:hypothetical protein